MSSTPVARFEPGRITGNSIGKSVKVVGQIYSKEDLYVDGTVEGTLEASEHKLTIGPHGTIQATIKAREVLVLGTIQGNVEAFERLEIRKDAKLMGDIRTARIVIEDGAYFKGSIDIIKPEPVKAAAKPPAAAAAARPPAAPTRRRPPAPWRKTADRLRRCPCSFQDRCETSCGDRAAVRPALAAPATAAGAFAHRLRAQDGVSHARQPRPGRVLQPYPRPVGPHASGSGRRHAAECELHHRSGTPPLFRGFPADSERNVRGPMDSRTNPTRAVSTTFCARRWITRTDTSMACWSGTFWSTWRRRCLRRWSSGCTKSCGRAVICWRSSMPTISWRSVPHYAFRIQDVKTLQVSQHGSRRPAQLFNNRSLEKLFARSESVKFFLTKDRLREVVVRA